MQAPGRRTRRQVVVLVIPLLLLMAYGALRLSTSFFQELRTVVFARVLARTSREITLRVFSHLHALSACVSISTAAPAASRAMSSAA